MRPSRVFGSDPAAVAKISEETSWGHQNESGAAVHSGLVSSSSLLHTTKLIRRTSKLLLHKHLHSRASREVQSLPVKPPCFLLNLGTMLYTKMASPLGLARSTSAARSISTLMRRSAIPSIVSPCAATMASASRSAPLAISQCARTAFSSNLSQSIRALPNLPTPQSLPSPPPRQPTWISANSQRMRNRRLLAQRTPPLLRFAAPSTIASSRHSP